MDLNSYHIGKRVRILKNAGIDQLYGTISIGGGAATYWIVMADNGRSYALYDSEFSLIPLPKQIMNYE